MNHFTQKDIEIGKFGPEVEIWPGGTRYGSGTEGYAGDMQMANKLTRQMMSALQKCRVCTKFLLGPREKANQVIWKACRGGETIW
jgi:hypothetical protein